jgi:hypothetical protein
MKTTKTNLLSVLTTLMVALSSTQAAVVFQDTFEGSSATVLGSPWTQLGTNLKADGSFSLSAGGSFTAYYSGVTMGAGGKWLISVDMSTTTRPGGSMFGLGLKAGAAPASVWQLMSTSNLNSGEMYAIPSTWTSGGWQAVPGGQTMGDGQRATYAIEVDNTGTDTLLSYYKGSTKLGTWANAGLGIIEYTSTGLVGYNTSSGDFNSFTIDQTAQIPEPSTYACLLGGIAALLLIRRRVQA